MANTTEILSEDEEKKIVAAIKNAEKKTSGELKVHIEKSSNKKPPYDRAKEVFEKLNMHATELKNGVLFYIAFEDKQFAILGDKGIDDAVPENFWEEIKHTMTSHFKSGDFSTGIIEGITMAGEQLKTHFPWQEDDINELNDDISKG